MGRVDKEIFEVMLYDWIADNPEIADKLEISEPYFDSTLGWVSDAEDDTAVYVLTCNDGEIILNYMDTK